MCFFILFEQQQFAKSSLERLGIEVSFDDAAMTNGNDTGLLAHRDNHRVGFVAQSDRRPVPHPERPIEITALRRGKSAGGIEHAIPADNYAPVVQWSLRKEHRD